MFKTIFFDANIFLDINDTKRVNSTTALKVLTYCLQKDVNIVTSCDLITTIYYIRSKNDRAVALQQIIDIQTMCHIIEFSNKEVIDTCNLMLEDSDYTDLEDTIQYVLAQKEGCDLILTNDRKFVSKELPIMTSKEFLEKFL